MPLPELAVLSYPLPFFQGTQTLWNHKIRVMAAVWVCRANSKPSEVPDVQRMGSAGAHPSAAFSTWRQRLGHATSWKWRGA